MNSCFSSWTRLYDCIAVVLYPIPSGPRILSLPSRYVRPLARPSANILQATPFHVWSNSYVAQSQALPLTRTLCRPTWWLQMPWRQIAWNRHRWPSATTMLTRLRLLRVISSMHPRTSHDDVIKWKHFPRYWPFVRRIHRSRWIPRTKVGDAKLWCFLWSVPE